MRSLFLAAAYLTVGSIACQAERPEDAVLAVYSRLQDAAQTGDADALIALWSPKSSIGQNAAAMKSMIRPQPGIRYETDKVLVQGDDAALIGHSAGDIFFSMRFVRESGAWKILDQAFSNVPIDPASIYTLVPPPDGPFFQAGLPWQNVPRAIGNTKYYQPEKLQWKLQATTDPAWLYIRVEAAAPLPAPDTEVKGMFPNLSSGVRRDWPVMRIRVVGGTPREYSFDVADQVADKATFDDEGKANSHHPYVVYSLLVWKGQHVAFTESTGLPVSPLITVGDRFIDMRIPLKALGVESSKQAIEISDANGPIGMFAPYLVKPFGRGIQ